MLKVIDGLRTVDGANAAIDISHADRDAGSGTASGAGHKMQDHAEFIASITVGTVDASTNLTVVVEESNDNVNFTAVPHAEIVLSAGTSNEHRLIGVDWRSPARKAYARVSGTVAGDGSSDFSVVGLRVRPKRNVNTLDGNVIEV